MEIQIKIPDAFTQDKKAITTSAYHIFISNSNAFAIGITSSASKNTSNYFLFYRLAPILLTFGLVEKVKVPAEAYFQRIHTSKLGYEFLKYCTLNPLNANKFKDIRMLVF